MTQGTVQVVAGVLAVVLIGIVLLRRKGKKTKGDEDDF
jgi:LPXTG-motif cell wall-anchored protein